MRSERLLAMLLQLQARSPIPASELAARLEVSVRTIYRDAETLSSAGVPVYAERGRSGGIALLPGYRTQVPGLTHAEASALFVALVGTSHTDLGLGDAIGSALRKLLASLPDGLRDAAATVGGRILVDPGRWGTAPDRAESTPPRHLDSLHRAVMAGRRVQVGYSSRRGRLPDGQSRAGVSSYTLDALGLVNKAGTWYVVAQHRRRPKVFRVDRISIVTLLDTAVRRPAGFDLATVWAELQRDYAATLGSVEVVARVRRPVLSRVLSFHGGRVDPDATDEGEWVRVNIGFPVLAAAQALLAHGDDVEVLGPRDVREHLSQTSARLHRLYPAQGAEAGRAG